jgi:hypothetical protein
VTAMTAKRAWSSRSSVLTLLATLGGFVVLVSATPSEADVGSRQRMLGAPSCSDDCNRKASDCLDGCEEKFKGDDKARVTCKFECTQTRQKCEKDCG